MQNNNVKLQKKLSSIISKLFSGISPENDASFIRKSGLFDTDWYLQRYQETAIQKQEPVEHYLVIGYKVGCNPNPLFNNNWYLDTYPDVLKEGINPLLHFLRYGVFEGRNPCPLFDTTWYLNGNPDVEKSGINPLKHFIQYGAVEGRNPHPLFAIDWYLQENPDVKEKGLNPLAHYLEYGAKARRSPHPLFDVQWYLEQYPDVARNPMNPLVHYLRFGCNEGRDPNPLFDTDWYLQKYAEAIPPGANPLIHFMHSGFRQGFDPHPDFDTDWYIKQYADVAQRGINPLVHFLSWGRRAGYKTRRPGMSYPTYDLTPGKRGIRRDLDNWDHEREAHSLELLKKEYSKSSTVYDDIFITVILPTYNRSRVVHQAVNSVLQQTHQNWELLIIDDGSTDGTETELRSLQADHRVSIRKIRHEGVSRARNEGLRHAKGKYIAYLDSDNTWQPDYLRNMLVFMACCQLDAAYCGVAFYDDNSGGSPVLYRGDDFNWHVCLEQNYIDMSAFVHARTAVSKAGEFDESLKRLVDWDFILRVTAAGRTSYLPFLGVNYYNGEHGGRITLTEYQHGELPAVAERIRLKHGTAGNYLQVDDKQYPLCEDILPGVQKTVHKSFPAGKCGDMDAVRKKRYMEAGRQDSERFIRLNDELINWQRLQQAAADRTDNLVSIIILCFHNEDLTAQCLASLLANTSSAKYNFEILVIDNANSRHTAELAEQYINNDRQITYIANQENYMFSLGNNIGVEHARGEYYILLNNDTTVEPGWLDPLIDPLDLDETTGIVGPKLLYPDDTLQCGGIVFNKYASIPYHIYRNHPRDAAEINKTRYFQAVTGACFSIRAADYIDLHGLNPVYINGCEDLDLCFRMRTELGKRIFYNPRSEIYHLEGRSEGRGKFIMYNREVFVDIWRGEIVPDDTDYYDEDGFAAVAYFKHGTEPYGETAAYAPELKPTGIDNQYAMCKAGNTERHSDPFNVGFSSMWYHRGITFHTRQLALALESKHIRTHVFARWESDKFNNKGAVHHPRVFNAGDDPTKEMMVQWAQENRIDLMVFMEVHPNDWKRVRALKDAGIKVMCYENLDILRLEDWDKYGIFDLFLFNAFYTRNIMQNKFPDIPSLMLPWGTIPIDPAPGKANGSRPVKFVHVAGWGGLNNRKNTGLLIRAFHKARVKNAELHLFSQAAADNYGEVCMKILAGNPSVFIHEGTIENIFEAYQNMDMLLWPSKREGLGLPIIEALSCGIPTLVSDGYMMKQWIIPGRHGMLCEAAPESGNMFLPEMIIDEGKLAEQINHISSIPEIIADMAENVLADRDIWGWSWQPAIFRDQIESIISDPLYKPSNDLDYLPKKILDFENERMNQ